MLGLRFRLDHRRPTSSDPCVRPYECCSCGACVNPFWNRPSDLYTRRCAAHASEGVKVRRRGIACPQWYSHGRRQLAPQFCEVCQCPTPPRGSTWDATPISVTPVGRVLGLRPHDFCEARPSLVPRVADFRAPTLSPLKQRPRPRACLRRRKQLVLRSPRKARAFLV